MTILKTLVRALLAALFASALTAGAAFAQDVTLKFHQFLPK